MDPSPVFPPPLRTVRANGLTLAYRETGPADAPPLLLLPARGESSADWAPVLGPLAAHRRVLALDPRGHGASEYPGTYSFPLLRDDVRAFLAALSLTRVDLVAHSLGGIIACLLAQEHPGLIRRLVLEDVPAPLPLATPPRPVPERPTGPLGYDWRMVLATEHPRNHPDPAWWERMDRADVPALVLAGGPTSVVDQSTVTALARRLPRARLVTVPAGHHIHATDPTAFLAHVLPFLTAHGPVPGDEPADGPAHDLARERAHGPWGD
ncbi:alpha/beta fold hydrolase [Streptomyces sp. SID11385]|uniref:alpha/beta fold hydrolase n=1 Tax=Streptomyces sp. SID11385 TaxID=2706031 RepID=UPI0013C80340|nr:alpha/beta fold hydrolase [Streptomyces sp. SID11385]NEA39200.1 alpha/beta hydrolase [Streptomyces sp. SID11385]